VLARGDRGQPAFLGTFQTLRAHNLPRFAGAGRNGRVCGELKRFLNERVQRLSGLGANPTLPTCAVRSQR
jgi:hypothetical protein